MNKRIKNKQAKRRELGITNLSLAKTRPNYSCDISFSNNPLELRYKDGGSLKFESAYFGRLLIPRSAKIVFCDDSNKDLK
jgi:hypothetical protein